MNKFKLVLMIFLFLVINSNICYSQQLPDSLKILTFNIYGAPNSQWPTRLGMILDELEQIQPDIIGFQEVVETPGFGGVDNFARVIAESLLVRTGVQYEFYWQRTHFSWSTYDEGVAIMTIHIVLENDFIDLPPGVFNRKAVMARVLTPFGIVDFFNTHLSYGDQQSVRNAQVEAIKNYISQKNADSVATITLLTGDFNSGPSAPSIQMLVQPDTSGVFYHDSWDYINPGVPGYTIPSNAPNDRIDYIFLKDGQYGEILDSKQVLKTPNAQNLYPSDHIGVASTFRTTIHNADLQIVSPLAGDEISGIVAINWAINAQVEPMTTSIYVSNDDGKNWSELWTGTSNSYQWNTLNYPDGTRYLLRLVAVGDSSFGYTQNAGTFTLNNPGNAAPEIEIIAPRTGQVINEQFLIEWSAADADGDTLSVDLEVSYDDGATWNGLAQNLLNDGSFTWNTLSYPNSPYYRIKLLVSDDSLQVEDISGTFTVQNDRVLLPDSLFVHVAGDGDGVVNSSVFDSTQFTGHLYRILFDDSTFSNTVYSVYDTHADSFVVENASQMDGVTEGPPFDGMRLKIFDYPQAQVDHPNTGWLIGDPDLDHTISIPELIIGGDVYEGYPYPADYQITMYDQVVDTSDTYLGAPATPMKFKVQNISENRQIDILFIEQDQNNTISAYDELYLLETDSTGGPMLTWLIYFGGNPPFIDPLPGDQFLFSTLKPFSQNDVFEFSTDYQVLSLDQVSYAAIDFKLFQNYPNPFNPLTNIEFQVPEQSRVKLEIFNISGQKIRGLINQNYTAGKYSVTWNGRNDSGVLVSSGVYMYRLRAESSEKRYSASGKLILLK